MKTVYVCGQHATVILTHKIRGLKLKPGSESALRDYLRLRNEGTLSKPPLIMIFGEITDTHREIIKGLKPPMIIEVLTSRDVALFGRGGRAGYTPTTHIEVQASQVGQPAWQVILLSLLNQH